MNTSNKDFSQDWKDASREIMDMVFDMQSFISTTVKFKAAADQTTPTDQRIRAVEVKGETLWQFIQASESQNLSRKAASQKLREILFSKQIAEVHVMTAERDLHCRIAKKGRVLISRSKKQLNRDANKNRAHDRDKDYPLTRFDSSKLLRVLGIADTNGEIKPSMRAKYRQVNEFLRILDAAFEDIRNTQNRTVHLVDVGCGKSYLSFSAKAFLEATRQCSIHLTGIDWNEKIVTSCNRMSDAMEWSDKTSFIASNIAEYKPTMQPDIVLSLHACDTATDEALAFGIEHEAPAILCAPCCQHELQSQLGTLGPHRSILRNGILKERLADILTDAFRAQILRVMGYRTNVVEFIDQEATARNILIRAARVKRTGTNIALAEYLDLAEEWKCTPFLATRIAHLCPELTPQANS